MEKLTDREQNVSGKNKTNPHIDGRRKKAIESIRQRVEYAKREGQKS